MFPEPPKKRFHSGLIQPFEPLDFPEIQFPTLKMQNLDCFGPQSMLANPESTKLVD